MIRTWKANMDCDMPFRDFRKGETVELDDSQVTPRVKALFTCLTPEQVEQSKEKPDPDFKVMVERLKAAKIPLRRGITKAEVRKLFNDFLAKPQDGSIAGGAETTDGGDKPTEGGDKPADGGDKPADGGDKPTEGEAAGEATDDGNAEGKGEEAPADEGKTE